MLSFFMFCLVFQTKTPSPNEAFINAINKQRDIVDWLIAYDRVAWKTSDKVMTEDESVRKRLGQEWFCLKKDDRWYGVYGKYDPDSAAYRPMLVYEMNDQGEAQAATPELDPTQMNALGSAIYRAAPLVRDAVGTPFPNHNTYVRRIDQNQIEVWILPAYQPNGVFVYGGDFRFVFDAKGRELISSQNTYTEYQYTRPDVEVEIDHSNLEIPPVGSLFFLQTYHNYFKDLSIVTQHHTTRLVGVKGKTSLVHVTHETIKNPWLETAQGCKVVSLGKSKQDKAVWDGACKDGYAHGPGLLTITGSDKTSTWDGGLKAGLRHGKGTIKSPNGTRQATFVDGLEQGDTLLIATDGYQYRGPSHQGSVYGWWQRTTPTGETSDYYRTHSRLARHILDLSWAAQSNNLPLAQKALDSGALINAYNVDGATPLLEAVLAGKEAMVSLLLKRGANPNLAHRTLGETPLVTARKLKAKAIAGLLINHGAIFDPSKGKTFPEAIAALPEMPALWARKAAAWVKIDSSRRALYCAEKAAALAPKDAQILWDLGNRLFDEGYLNRAAETFDKALAIKESPRLWNDRGFTLERIQREDEALESYANAAKMDPKDYLPWMNRGGLLHRLDRLEEALAAMDQALERKPDHAPAMNGRAIILGKLKRYDEAITQIDKAIQTNPSSAQFKLARKWLLREKEKQE